MIERRLRRNTRGHLALNESFSTQRVLSERKLDPETTTRSLKLFAEHMSRRNRRLRRRGEISEAKQQMYRLRTRADDRSKAA